MQILYNCDSDINELISPTTPLSGCPVGQTLEEPYSFIGCPEEVDMCPGLLGVHHTQSVKHAPTSPKHQRDVTARPGL